MAVLLVNLGTPDKPTVKSIKKYLKEFLSDPRVIDTPSWLWWPLLNGIILPLRSRKIVANYQKIWLKEGSPLRVLTDKLSQALQVRLKNELNESITVLIGMNYGTPSIAEALNQIQKQQIKRVVILPLFPQYSATTTAAVFDIIAKYYSKQVLIPELHFIREYHDHSHYIRAIANSVDQYWSAHGKPQHLIFSFHSIPKRYYEKGDLYPEYCHQTARLIANSLHLADGEWTITFQSRFGPQEWIKPYTFDTLQSLAKTNIKKVDVISPGFAADCLETLEELAILNKNAFLDAGGAQYRYIPALNDNQDHIELLYQLIKQYTAN